MRAFEDLFLQTRVQNITNRGKLFQIFLPRYHENGASPQVKITIKEMYQGASSNYSPGFRYNYYHNVPFTINSDSPSAEVDISHLIDGNNLGLSVSVEYTDPHGTPKNLPYTSLPSSQ